MRILVSGASGLVGRALVARLRATGHDVVALVRRDSGPGRGVLWDPDSGRFDHPGCEGADAVVHLAGENIASGRWTTARKERLRSSRVAGTLLLANGLARLARPPKVFVGASAIGIYGDRHDETLTERSEPGRGFLAELSAEWEAASATLDGLGVRRVLLRIGLVLAREGGALGKLALPFRCFAGGRTGSGRQWMSWITLDDLVAVIERTLVDDALRGVLNTVSPTPCRNAEFARTIGRVLRRPAWLPAPAFALRLALGEMADALLLTSHRVVPERLEQAGFRFADRELEPALRRLLRA
jgi:uncharacterized protein (TIGR01777 family)